jgi:hypothetical protein
MSRKVGVLELPRGEDLENMADHEIMTAFHWLRDKGMAEVNAVGEMTATRAGAEINNADRLLRALCTARAAQP